jgi:lipopolysaccharide transport system permease protein
VAVDIDRIMTMGLGVLLYVTPVVYSSGIDNALVQTITRWNPLTYLVCSARDIIIYGRLYHNVGYLVCAGLALLLFLVSWRLFYVSEHQIIERMI